MTRATLHPVDEVAVATTLRRLDALAVRHPELTAPHRADDVADWIETLQPTDEDIMGKEPTTQVAFRLPDKLIERLDRHVERMNGENPGLEFSRADAVRSLLTRALDTIEPVKRGKG